MGIVDHDLVELNNMHRQVQFLFLLFPFSIAGSTLQHVPLLLFMCFSFFWLNIFLALFVCVHLLNLLGTLLPLLTFDSFVHAVFQIIHTETYIGQPKVKSAASACRSYVALTPTVLHINFHGETETESPCEISFNCL